MTRGEINVDPIEGEFFSTEVLGSLPDALVREAIQNSLDAGIPGLYSMTGEEVLSLLPAEFDEWRPKPGVKTFLLDFIKKRARPQR